MGQLCCFNSLREHWDRVISVHYGFQAFNMTAFFFSHLFFFHSFCSFHFRVLFSNNNNTTWTILNKLWLGWKNKFISCGMKIEKKRNKITHEECWKWQKAKVNFLQNSWLVWSIFFWDVAFSQNKFTTINISLFFSLVFYPIYSCCFCYLIHFFY